MSKETFEKAQKLKRAIADIDEVLSEIDNGCKLYLDSIDKDYTVSDRTLHTLKGAFKLEKQVFEEELRRLEEA